VFSESAIPIAIGMLVGAALAFVVTPLFALLLFGENPHDATVFALVIGGLTAVMIAAGGRPAYQVATAPLTDSLREAYVPVRGELQQFVVFHRGIERRRPIL
jgi:hypothetical protein